FSLVYDLLYLLSYRHFYTQTCSLQKFSDDSAVVGCISKGDESEYWAVGDSFVTWCKQNNLQLNVAKTKEFFNFAMYYDVNKDQCTPFLYNGEGGNANRFENERECMRNCSPNAENIYPMDGECNGKYLRYYYDSIDKKCKRFLWTGCLGNGNRFFDYNSCNSTSSKACLLKQTEGGCNGNCVKYYYDSREEKCKEFIWTGCVGNGNRFHDYNSCNSTCSGVKGKNTCLLKRAEGGCNGNCVKYYYDSSDKKCKEFIWTGCSGNGNRFHDYNSCNSSCSGVKCKNDVLSFFLYSFRY
uniref:BPTI/Kunitz inhibitor domain-containing protein n=1 Tax=Neolamprologus brichardi TaxID=32507 RepID=A0A3Q4MYY4_NEOBR